MKAKGITILPAVILLVILAAACSAEEARQAGERAAENRTGSESGPRADGETSQVVVRETSVPEATESTSARLEDVILTNEEGSSEPVQTFRTRLDDVVYVSGETVGLPEGTELSASWIAEEVPEYENKEALSGEEIVNDTVEIEGDRPFELGAEEQVTGSRFLYHSR